MNKNRIGKEYAYCLISAGDKVFGLYFIMAVTQGIIAISIGYKTWIIMIN